MFTVCHCKMQTLRLPVIMLTALSGLYPNAVTEGSPTSSHSTHSTSISVIGQESVDSEGGSLNCVVEYCAGLWLRQHHHVEEDNSILCIMGWGIPGQQYGGRVDGYYGDVLWWTAGSGWGHFELILCSKWTNAYCYCSHSALICIEWVQSCERYGGFNGAPSECLDSI